MKNSIFKIAILLTGVIISSCVKPKTTVPAPTVLAIHCIDIQGNPIQGTEVVLYDNQSRQQNATMASYAGTTNANGDVSFSGVNAQVYYFWCVNSQNCLINWAQQSTGNALGANTTNTRDIVLSGYGTLSVTDTDSYKLDWYSLTLNGQAIWGASSILYQDTVSTILTPGTYTLASTQQTGNIKGNPKKVYNITISQCQSYLQKIP